jgi:uncharacterized small protein (DUF1192 family)
MTLAELEAHEAMLIAEAEREERELAAHRAGQHGGDPMSRAPNHSHGEYAHAQHQPQARTGRTQQPQDMAPSSPVSGHRDAQRRVRPPSQSPERTGPGSAPYGTDMSLQESLARTAALERELLGLQQAKNLVQAEYVKLAPGRAGSTIKVRKHKVELEERLEDLDAKINRTKATMRDLGVLR